MKKLLFTPTNMQKAVDGRKTETRRLAGLKLFNEQPDRWKLKNGMMLSGGGFPRVELLPKPAYAVGDIVVGASAWAVELSLDHLKPTEIPPEYLVWYAGMTGSNGEMLPTPSTFGKYRPGRFLPKTLYHYMPKFRITAVRVERLQDITEDGAKAEGAKFWYRVGDGGRELTNGGYEYAGVNVPEEKRNYIYGFRSLWNSINENRGHGWDTNPWVWVFGFEKVR